MPLCQSFFCSLVLCLTKDRIFFIFSVLLNVLKAWIVAGARVLSEATFLHSSRGTRLSELEDFALRRHERYWFSLNQPFRPIHLFISWPKQNNLDVASMALVFSSSHYSHCHVVQRWRSLLTQLFCTICVTLGSNHTISSATRGCLPSATLLLIYWCASERICSQPSGTFCQLFFLTWCRRHIT